MDTTILNPNMVIDPWSPTPAKQKNGRHVYLFSNLSRGAVKIGVATNVRQRFQGVQNACPDQLGIIGVITNGGGGLEHQLHRWMRENRIRGEWFRLTRGILNWCIKHKEALLAGAIEVGVEDILWGRMLDKRYRDEVVIVH